MPEYLRRFCGDGVEICERRVTECRNTRRFLPAARSDLTQRLVIEGEREAQKQNKHTEEEEEEEEEEGRHEGNENYYYYYILLLGNW